MKIINQSENQMSLKDGNVTSLILGAVFIIVGVFGAFGIYSASRFSIPFWVMAVFFLIGLIIIFTSAAILVTIDKTQNQISFLKKRLIGSKAQNYNIQNVLRVELRKSYKMEAGTRNQNGTITPPRQILQHQAVIVFKDGTEVPLENVKNSSGVGIGAEVLLGGTGKELSISNQIANFLGVPFQEIGPGAAPTIGIGGIKIGL
jgi:Tetraspanin family.